MTDTDMLYMASLEKRNAELEARVAELEEKHWNECGQIAHYSDENAKLKELLRKAVEDFTAIAEVHAAATPILCPKYYGAYMKAIDVRTRKWRYAAEALALIGEGTNVPASADDTNVGHKSGGWISCKDRMPDDNELVLFCYVGESGIKSVHYGYHQTVRGLGSSWGKISGGWRYCNDDVTHWMPLPEPPKDGDTNG